MKLTNKQRRRWQKYVNGIKKQMPAGFPVHIRTRLMKKHDGLAWKNGDQFEIRIDSGLVFDAKVDKLEHEYAHILGWKYSDEVLETTWEEDHDEIHALLQFRVRKVRESISDSLPREYWTDTEWERNNSL